VWYAEAGTDRLLLRPDDVGGDVVPHSDVDMVVFPQFGDHDEILVMDAPTSFARLCAMLLNPAPEDSIMALARVVALVPCYSMSYSTTNAALAAIDNLATRPRPGYVNDPVALTDAELSGIVADVWGIRFGDDVVLINRSSGHVVHLSGWPAGATFEVESWSAIVGLTR
jgi:hypothetical protein